MAGNQQVLYSVPQDYELVEFRLQMPHRSEGSGQAILTLGFMGDEGPMSLRFLGPYPFDATFAVTDDAPGIRVFDSASDQWEHKRVRLEFVTGEGQTVVIWAESVERIE
ncbi:MAG: hypothetical protein JO112_15060 [Planctomycetes bacterium]|nr:hypothetical protein [Planctomycetota bacterium]